MLKSKWNLPKERYSVHNEPKSYRLSIKGNIVTLSVTFRSMYDTLRMVFPSDSPLRLMDRLQGVQVISDAKTGVLRARGKCENMNVFIGESGIVKVEGSLAKYYFGDNLKTLTHSSTIEAIEKLSSQLNTNIEKAIVSRMDIATNLFVSTPIHHLLDSFGNLSHHSKAYHRRTGQYNLYYECSRRKAKFYDKKREMMKKKCWDITNTDLDNVCRYELSLSSRVASQFKKSIIEVKDLIDPTFYNRTIDEWLRIYNRIPKKRTLKDIEEMKVTSVHQIRRYLSAFALQVIGEDEILQLIEKTQMDRMQRSRLKKAIRDLQGLKTNTIDNEGIIELDAKVLEAVATYKK